MLKQTLEDKPSNKTLWSLLGRGPWYQVLYNARLTKNMEMERKGYGEGVSRIALKAQQVVEVDCPMEARWQPTPAASSGHCHLTSCHCPYFFPFPLLLPVAYFWHYHYFCLLCKDAQWWQHIANPLFFLMMHFQLLIISCSALCRYYLLCGYVTATNMWLHCCN